MSADSLAACLREDFKVSLRYTQHHLAKMEKFFDSGDISGVAEAKVKVVDNLAHMERILDALKSHKE